MNPIYKALTGGFTAGGAPTQNVPPMQLGAGFDGIFGRAQQLAGILQNPQNLVQRFFADAPAEVTQDPEQLLGWMQQTGRVNPQMVQMVRQMVGR